MTGCGHGHVFLEPGGLKARCGGPRMCRLCAIDAAMQSAIAASEEPTGCICPPGANKECQAPTCPRKPFPTQGT